MDFRRVVDGALFALLAWFCAVLFYLFWGIWVKGVIVIREPWRDWLAFEMVLVVGVGCVSLWRLWDRLKG